MVRQVDGRAGLVLAEHADVDRHLEVGSSFAGRAIRALEALPAVTVVPMLAFGDVGGGAP